MTTSSSIATKKDFQDFVTNQFWRENLLENYVMYSTEGSRIWGLPTLNMIAFIPMSIVEGCLSPVFGSISALKNVVFLNFKGAGASFNASLSTSADCFKRIGQIFKQYISLSTPEYSDFWNDREDIDIRPYFINESDLNLWTDRVFSYLAYLSNSISLVFDHSQSRFEAALPDELSNKIKEINGINGQGFIVEYKAGKQLNNPPELHVYSGLKVVSIWYENLIGSRAKLTPSENDFSRIKFPGFECKKVRLYEIAPCLPPSHRRLIAGMLT